MYPRLVFDTEKFRQNVRFLKEKLQKHSICLAAVTKVFAAKEELIQVLLDEEVEILADSRIENLKNIGPRAKRLLLRLPMLSQVEEVIAHSEISLVSERETILALDEVATKKNKPYEVILMVDLGDLREGVLEGDVIPFIESLGTLKRVKFKGLGTNLTCFGGILPSKESLTRLVELNKQAEEKLGYELDIVSGGNSSSLFLLDKGEVPKGVSQLRLGESLVLGRDTALLESIEGMNQDIFTLEAELVEVKVKPSKPWGPQGADAFGNEVSFEDKGPMKRGILAVGKQDVHFDGLTPYEDVECIGSSSDHLLLDLKNQDYKVGDIIHFNVDYGALLQLVTSNYIEKVAK